MLSLQYREAVERLYSLQRFGVKLGLEKITSFLVDLDNPQNTFHSCHIAGTNGKGTCAAVVQAVLSAHGISAGLYTSPHLVDLRERVRVGGAAVPESFVAYWVGKHLDYALRRKVTFFETVTALAFDYFREQRVEAAAVEVGLGGKFDATNVVQPAVSVITSIGLEHTLYLGKSLSAIAGEKAGIAKPGVPLLCGETGKRALASIKAAAQEAGSPLSLLDEDTVCIEREVDRRGTRFDYRGPGLSLDGALVPLYGRHSLRNVALGLQAAGQLLGKMGAVPEAPAVREALANLSWPARFQRLSLAGGVELVLDVAHNPPAAARLAEVYRRVYGGRRAVVVSALASDKDYRRFLRKLLKLTEVFIFPEVDFGRKDTPSVCRDPQELREFVESSVPGARALAGESMEAALERAFALAQGKPVVVTGSFHTVGAAIQVLGIKV